MTSVTTSSGTAPVETSVEAAASVVSVETSSEVGTTGGDEANAGQQQETRSAFGAAVEVVRENALWFIGGAILIVVIIVAVVVLSKYKLQKRN